MMNLEQYFEKVMATEGFEGYEREFEELAELVQESEETAVEQWFQEREININATKVVNGRPVRYLTLFIWELEP